MKLKKGLLSASLLLLAAASSSVARAQTTTSPPPRPAAPRPGPTPYPIAVVEDASAPAGWRRYRFGNAPTMSVVMPARPDASAQRSGPAPNAVVHLYITASQKGVYGAARLDGLPINIERSTEAERQGFFETYVSGFARGFQQSLRSNNLEYELRLTGSKKVRAAGREAFEQEFTVGPFRGRAQLVFVGTGAFCVVSIWPPDTPAADYEAFFKSFRIGGAAGAN